MIINSKNKNSYYYDLPSRKMMLLHPELARVVNEKTPCTAPEKPGDDYYTRKAAFLKEHGLLNPDCCRPIDFREITAPGIRDALANTPQVTFELTDRCNMQCKYCGYGSLYSAFDRRDYSNMPFQTAKAVIDYLFTLWNSPLNRSHERNIYMSFYGGEPLLNFPLIEEMVAYINGLPAHHNRFIFTMTSNGVLIDKYADFLARHNIKLLISLDGNERNNSYRVFKNGDPTFAKIVENVEKLRLRHPAYFENSVNFNAVFHNRNSIVEIHRFFKEKFGKFPAVRHLSTSGINEERKKEFWAMYANVDDSLKEAEDYSVIEREMLTKLPSSESLSFFLHYNCSFSSHDYNQLLAPEADCSVQPTGTCFPFAKKVFVTAKGLLLPCEKISFRHYLGQVKGDKVELDFEEIAARYNKMYAQLLSTCRRCIGNYACLQCLFHLSKDDSMESCQGFMTIGQYREFIGELVSYTIENPDLYSNILRNVVVE
jgi:uncharacterized protein